MPHHFKNSSFILSAHYDPKDNILTVTFKNGKEYKYSNCDADTYNEFCNAESPGKHFGSLKGKLKQMEE